MTKETGAGRFEGTDSGFDRGPASGCLEAGLQPAPPKPMQAGESGAVARHRRILGYGLGLLFCLGMAGCAVGPDFVPPVPPSVTQYTSGKEPSQTVTADGQAQHFEAAAKIAADWWHLFKFPKLDRVAWPADTGYRPSGAAALLQVIVIITGKRSLPWSNRFLILHRQQTIPCHGVIPHL
jgi:hypothetical protein